MASGKLIARHDHGAMNAMASDSVLGETFHIGDTELLTRSGERISLIQHTSTGLRLDGKPVSAQWLWDPVHIRLMAEGMLQVADQMCRRHAS